MNKIDLWKNIYYDERPKQEGYYRVKVEIEWIPIAPPMRTIDKIEINELNIRLQMKADAFADEIRKRFEASHDRL